MRQVLLRKGRVTVSEVPAPSLPARNVLVEVSHSLISTGTELSTVEASGATLAEKAARPGAITKVIDSIKVRGVRRTLSLVQARLDAVQQLGYSCAGTVIAVGADVTEFQAGDRVACAGAGLANHAEIVSVPVTLVTRVPEGLDGVSASFVTLGAIAMQGVRRADVRIGETVCVIGLGLIGQITVSLLRAAGCRVIGFDPDGGRVTAALNHGLTAGAASDPELESVIRAHTEGRGVDATLITASSPSSNPTRAAFHVTRKKGRIVVVGSVGMDLERSPFYEKEQDFVMSCSYGPGRYDPSYEEGGNDYPYAYVRWTENRNMASFISLVAAGDVSVAHLVSRTFPLAEAEAAYTYLGTETPRPMAAVLVYEGGAAMRSTPPVPAAKAVRTTGQLRIGLIGAGVYARTAHLPNLQALGRKVRITAVCAATGASAAATAQAAGATIVTTDYNELLRSPEVDAVLIATRHDSHAEIAAAALKAGKHVYLEKPLALTSDEIRLLDEALRAQNPRPLLMVGLNRRFAPFSEAVIERLSKRVGPLVAVYRVNAGALPSGHWTQGAQGGGRLRGEACHMIDLFQALVGKPMTDTAVTPLVGASAGARPDENFSAQFRFSDGSLCELVYTSLGHPGPGKERLEVFWDGQSAVIDDFKSLGIHGVAPLTLEGPQDKGQMAALNMFVDAAVGGAEMPVAWEELCQVAQVAIDLDAEVWGKSASR